jgi:hypothetical protein
MAVKINCCGIRSLPWGEWEAIPIEMVTIGLTRIYREIESRDSSDTILNKDRHSKEAILLRGPRSLTEGTEELAKPVRYLSDQDLGQNRSNLSWAGRLSNENLQHRIFILIGVPNR